MRPPWPPGSRVELAWATSQKQACRPGASPGASPYPAVSTWPRAPTVPFLTPVWLFLHSPRSHRQQQAGAAPTSGPRAPGGRSRGLQLWPVLPAALASTTPLSSEAPTLQTGEDQQDTPAVTPQTHAGARAGPMRLPRLLHSRLCSETVPHVTARAAATGGTFPNCRRRVRSPGEAAWGHSPTLPATFPGRTRPLAGRQAGAPGGPGCPGGSSAPTPGSVAWRLSNS